MPCILKGLDMWTESTAKASVLPIDTIMRSLRPNFIDSRIASPLDGLLDQWSQDKKVHILYDIGDVNEMAGRSDIKVPSRTTAMEN